jgi:hypothetical protein
LDVFNRIDAYRATAAVAERQKESKPRHGLQGQPLPQEINLTFQMGVDLSVVTWVIRTATNGIIDVIENSWRREAKFQAPSGSQVVP